MMQIIGIAHALLLHHIGLIREMPIEKDIIYITLVKGPLVMDYNVKNSNNDEIYQGIESLLKVNTRLLVKAFSNKSSSISCNRAIGILFDAKHPFVAHYILPRDWENKRLSTIPNESIILFLHSINSLRILESSEDNARFRERGKYGGETISRVGFGVDIFRVGLHGMKV